MKLLITGATGFVGRNLLISQIQKREYEEIILPVRSLSKLKRQLNEDGFSEVPSYLKIVEGSAGGWNLDSIEVDHVVHSAGVIFARTKKEYFDTNVLGTTALLREIKPPKKLIVLSSQSASGPSTGMDFRTENDFDSPVTWYGESKLEMEKELARDFSHLNYVILRPPMIFGARDQATLPLFKMVKKPIRFKSGFATKYYSYLSVNDLVNAIELSLKNDSNWRSLEKKYFFVASKEPISDEILIQEAGKVMNKEGFLIKVPQPLLWAASRVIDSIPTWRATIPSLSVDRAKEIWPDRWVVSPQAFCHQFHWEPKDSFQKILKETCDWYQKAGQLQ